MPIQTPEVDVFRKSTSSDQGVSPSEEKIAAVVNARAPRNASEVRSFVQPVQYSSKFISNFSQVAEPLRKLLRNGQSLFGELNSRKHLKTQAAHVNN